MGQSPGLVQASALGKKECLSVCARGALPPSQVGQKIIARRRKRRRRSLNPSFPFHLAPPRRDGRRKIYPVSTYCSSPHVRYQKEENNNKALSSLAHLAIFPPCLSLPLPPPPPPPPICRGKRFATFHPHGKDD